MWPKLYSDQEFIRRYCFSCKPYRVLNAGSSDVRYGGDCVNVDIQAKPNVDYVCDIHELPFRDNSFDIVICNAVLQYCKNPFTVANQVDANVQSINDVTITGNGQVGTEFSV